MKKEGQSKTKKLGSKVGRGQSAKVVKKKKFKKRHDKSLKKKGMYAIVRVMGHGQYKVDNRTAKLIIKKDLEMVKIIQTHEQAEREYARSVAEVESLVKKSGIPLDYKEIVQSDIIVPAAEVTINDAKNLFRGVGFIH